jgi:hypothetical protein
VPALYRCAEMGRMHVHRGQRPTPTAAFLNKAGRIAMKTETRQDPDVVAER